MATSLNPARYFEGVGSSIFTETCGTHNSTLRRYSSSAFLSLADLGVGAAAAGAGVWAKAATAKARVVTRIEAIFIYCPYCRSFKGRFTGRSRSPLTFRRGRAA